MWRACAGLVDSGLSMVHMNKPTQFRTVVFLGQANLLVVFLGTEHVQLSVLWFKHLSSFASPSLSFSTHNFKLPTSRASSHSTDWLVFNLKKTSGRWIFEEKWNDLIIIIEWTKLMIQNHLKASLLFIWTIICIKKKFQVVFLLTLKSKISIRELRLRICHL